MPHVRYLDHADIVACGLTHDDIRTAVADVLIAKRRGEAITRRKFALPAPGGAAAFSAKGGVWLERAYAAVKWYGYAGDNATLGLADFHPLLVLSRADTGVPLAIMDGRWITEVRTAAITVAAAGVLANSGSSTVGFVACGAQARAHLAALRRRFPLRLVTAYSRNRDTAERFAAEARDSGLDARATADAREAVSDQDIVVTSIPMRSDRREYLDASWLRAHAFASMVDLGYSWSRATLAALAFVVTDDLDPDTRQPTELLNFDGSFDAELSELLCASRPLLAGRRGPSALIFGGTGLADVAAAVAVYERAQTLRIGRRLEL